MKISKVEIFQLEMPIVGGEFKQSGGRVWRVLDSTVLRVTTDSGLEGWGESCPFGSNYLNASPNTARAGMMELAPTLLGEDPRDLVQLYAVMDRALVGHPHVKTAFDMAAWDLLGKAASMPIYRLMGGFLSDDLCKGKGFFTLDLSDVSRDLMQGYKESGCTYFEFKASGDPATDIAMSRLIADQMIPGDVLKIDANQGWRVDQAIGIARALDDVNILFEQPCMTYEECLAFKTSTGRAMSLDECILDLQGLLRAVADHAVDAINLKIGRVGGLTPARQIRDVAAKLGIPMFIQETSGGDIGAAATAHLAHSTPPGVLLSAWDCSTAVTVETATGLVHDPAIEMRAGNTPGLGVEPILEVFKDPVAVFEA